MKVVEAIVKKGVDDQIASLEQQVVNCKKMIEDVRTNLTVYDAVQHKGETEEVDTTGGKAIINEGDYLLSSPDRVMVVPKGQVENPDIWTEIE